MSRYKVLPLPVEFTDDFAEFAYIDPWDRENEIEPIFNRPGLYYDREKDVCWVETTHGSWIIGDKEKFQSELEYHAQDQFILHPDVIKAFKALESHNMLTRELRDAWWKHRHAVQLRETYRGARKYIRKLDRNEV